MATDNSICILCGNSASGDNRSTEHVIPQSLGGRWAVSGFICRGCNNETGRTWDADLAASFEGLIRLLDISREEPLPPARVVYTSDGTPVRVLPRNLVEMGHPVVPKDLAEGSQVAVRDIEELHRILQTMNDRRNLGIDVEATLQSAKTCSRYLDELIELPGGGWGPEHYKSLVKSALSMLFRTGHDPASAEVALAYLSEHTELRCFFPYYNKDLLSERETGVPINCVYVKGDPETCESMAYVEIFGILRSVIRLSEKYEGEYFEHGYAFNPIDGRELDVTVRLNSEILRKAELEPDYFGSETGALEAAIEAVLRMALRNANSKELERLIVSAVDQYFVSIGKAPDEPVTEDEYQEMWNQVEELVTPFLEHLLRPTLPPPYPPAQ